MATPVDNILPPTIPPAVPPVVLTKKQHIIKKILLKIWDIVKFIFKSLALTALFYVNPTIFAVGFASGLIWNKKAQETIDKVHRIFRKQKMMFTTLVVAAAFITLPVTLAGLSLYGSLRLGCRMAAGAA